LHKKKQEKEKKEYTVLNEITEKVKVPENNNNQTTTTIITTTDTPNT